MKLKQFDNNADEDVVDYIRFAFADFKQNWLQKIVVANTFADDDGGAVPVVRLSLM